MFLHIQTAVSKLQWKELQWKCIERDFIIQGFATFKNIIYPPDTAL